MALIKCTECSNDISDKATACPKCGAPVVLPERPISKTPLIVGLAIGGALLLFVMLAEFNKANETPEQRENQAVSHQVSAARSMCKRFIEGMLHAPATAKFQSEYDFNVERMAPTKQSNPRFVVRGHVDAQNAFGALIRTTFSCTLDYDLATGQLNMVAHTSNP